MDYEQIAYGLEDRIATITLDPPEQLNAFTVRMQEELVDALDRADAHDDVRGVVVTGRGRGFCAGADLSAGSGTFDHESTVAGGAGAAGAAGGGAHRDEGGLGSLRGFAM